MGDSDRKDTLQKYVSDMLALTKHIHDAVERQLKDDSAKSDPVAYPIITRLDGVLETQISTLETHLEQIGGDGGSPIKEAISAVAGVVAGITDKVRMADTVSKMLRDDYTALSLAAISYTMLHTTGLALKDDATATMAQNQLTALTPIIVEISEQIPHVVVRDLQDDSEIIDQSVGSQAVSNTQKAWDRNVVDK